MLEIESFEDDIVGGGLAGLQSDRLDEDDEDPDMEIRRREAEMI